MLATNAHTSRDSIFGPAGARGFHPAAGSDRLRRLGS